MKKNEKPKKESDKFFNLKDSYVKPKHRSEESLRRCRSARTIVKNPYRRSRMVADLDRLSEVEKEIRHIRGLSKPNSRLSVCVKQEQVRVALCIRDALKLIEAHVDVPIWDVSSSEYIASEAAEARRFEDFFDGVRSISDDDAAISLIMQSVHSFSLNGKYRRRIMSWEKGELLGSGSFGSVHEGFTDDGFFFAVKEVSLQDQGTQGKQSILQLEQFEHDNIVQYLGTDKDENRLYIFIELVTKGSLANLYQKYHLSDSQVSSYTRQILNGLTYLHERNVVHRDIKCANILVDAGGLAPTTNDVKSSKGTPFWVAPEVMNLKNNGYGLSADIWSLGCTVLEMLTRQPPYSHLEDMQALFRIGRGKLPSVPNSFSRDARDFILKCLQVNPNDRPTAAQLMEHPFVKRPLQTSR
ncbi:hypothetical protein CUMW_186780, partial [Citrus unshiu]